MRVFVYWNLHRHCWSIKALEGAHKGRVVAHAARVNLSSCQFKVSAAGRARVLREQRKNVHAGVVGQWDGHGNADKPTLAGAAVAVTYNPYRFASFVDAQSHTPITRAAEAHLGHRTVEAWGAQQ